jgi:hypothetical protein
MPVAVVSVPLPLWNHVVLQATLFGLEMFPDKPTGENTVIELTGTWDKLNEVYNRSATKGVWKGVPRKFQPEQQSIMLVTVANKLPITGGA